MQANDNNLTVADDEALVRLLRETKARLVVIAPALPTPIATVLAEQWQKLGAEKVVVSLDPDPENYRLGYGDVAALELLERTATQLGTSLRRRNGVTIGIIIADDKTLIYAPPSPLSSRGHLNGLLLHGPLLEHECPAPSKEGSAAHAPPEEEKISPATVQAIQKDLADNPPLDLKAAEVLRVFNSAIEFVELELSQTRIERKRVQLPNELLGLAGSPELRERMRTSFKLIGDADAKKLSGRHLDDNKREITKEFPVEAGGTQVETDVVVVAFTPLNYRLFLDARRAVQAEPSCPLDTPQSRTLLDSIRQRRCVLFAGAGLSGPAGLPDWNGLLRELAAELGLDVAQLPRDPAGQLSLELCLDLAQWHADRFGRDKLEQRVHDLFGRTESRTPPVCPTLAHYLLSALPFRLFLTTNYDNLFERTLTALRRDPEVVCRPEAVVQTGQSDRPCVVKLHGDATERTPIVLTRDDFDGFFRAHPVTAALLQGLLLNHTFLFVGYDLRDPNTRQVYSGVAHLLGKVGTRAYSVVVRDEDVTSQFYESQWGRQGLITLRMPGPDRIHNSLRFFDWLSRETCELHSFLHPDLRAQGLPTELGDLEHLRDLLYQVSDQIVEALTVGVSGTRAADRTTLLAAIVDLFARLGWRPKDKGGLGRIWEELACASQDHRDKMQFLRRAMETVEGVGDLDRIRGQIKMLTDRHPAEGQASDLPIRGVEGAHGDPGQGQSQG